MKDLELGPHLVERREGGPKLLKHTSILCYTHLWRLALLVMPLLFYVMRFSIGSLCVSHVFCLGYFLIVNFDVLCEPKTNFTAYYPSPVENDREGMSIFFL